MRTFLVSLSCLCLVTVTAAADTIDRERLTTEILWSAVNPPFAAFVPSSVLESSPLEDLPLRESTKASIRRMLEAPRCQDVLHFRKPGEPDYSAITLEELAVRPGLVVLIGDVLALVAGLNVFSIGPETVVYIEVTEVLKGYVGTLPDVHFSAGQVVGLLEREGNVLIDGKQLCLVDRFLPLLGLERGTSVLIIAYPTDHHPQLLHAGQIHVVDDGVILPTPYRGLRNRSAVPVELFERELSKVEAPK